MRFKHSLVLSIALTSALEARAQDGSSAEVKALREQVEGLNAKNRELQDSANQSKVNAAEAKQQAAEAKQQAADAVKKAKEQATQAATEAKAEAAKRGLDAINALKFVSVSIGVLPNSDHKANNQANLSLHYTPQLTSEVIYLNRNLGRTASSTTTIPSSPDGLLPPISQQSSASSATEDTRIALTILRYKPTGFSLVSTTVQPSVGLGVDQLRRTTSHFIINTQSFPDPKSGAERNVITTAQINENTISTLPILSIGLATSNATGFNVDVGAGAIVASKESYSWRENGTGSIPPLTIDTNAGSEIPAQAVELHDNHTNKFKSNGFKAHLDLGYDTEDHGFRLHGDYLLKVGKRTSYELDIASADPAIDPATGKVTNEGAKTVTEVQSTVKETVAQAHGALGWKMKFLGRYGVVPELTFDMEVDRTVLAQAGSQSSNVAKQFAVGVLVDY